MITHLTPENERLLRNMRGKLSKLERNQNMIKEHKSVSKKYISEHDNYGILDIFKSKENRYSANCGEYPTQSNTESPEDFAQREEAYKQCVATEEAKFKAETDEQAKQAGNTATLLEGWYNQATGGSTQNNTGQPIYQGEGGSISFDDGSKEDTILGLPKIAFYTLAGLAIVLLFYILFFKGKK